MSNRNFLSRAGGRHHSDPVATRYNTKYNQRGGARNNRPDNNRRPTGGDDVDSLMVSINRHLTTDGNALQDNRMGGRTVRQPIRGGRPRPASHSASENLTGWWRIAVQKAGTIGKERVMSTLKTHCPRQFQAYHVMTRKLP